MSTPHINAKPEDFAKTVLMPGDPLRSKFIAETFLENPVLVNNVRGVQGYTGTYNTVFADQFRLPGHFTPIASFDLLRKAVDTAEAMNVNYRVGNLLSNDLFYDDSGSTLDWQKLGVLAVEMEAAALYMNAARAGKNALAICTISDNLVTGEECTAEERQNTFTKMMELALTIA